MAEIHHNKVPLLKGDEPFIYQNGNKAGFTILDFWRFQFSNLLDMQGRVGEFIVAMALGKMDPDNNNGWTLWDIDYRETRIEVKTTAYFQPWRFERDENGNIINDDGKIKVSLGDKSWSYDSEGNLVRNKKQLEKETNYAYTQRI